MARRDELRTALEDIRFEQRKLIAKRRSDLDDAYRAVEEKFSREFQPLYEKEIELLDQIRGTDD